MPLKSERRELGELPPDQSGTSDRQFATGPADGDITAGQAKWGPKLPVINQVWRGPKLLEKVG
jgi:hypothetical protein